MKLDACPRGDAVVDRGQEVDPLAFEARIMARIQHQLIFAAVDYIPRSSGSPRKRGRRVSI